MPLAYLFWHWPSGDTDPDEYERRLRDFHGALELPASRTFRLERAPYDGALPRPYEDWYPVEDWRALGELNDRAVSGARRGPHDAAAAHAASGAGGVYALIRPHPPGTDAAVAAAHWLTKPAGVPYARFHEELAAAVPDATIWQRQMVLGPAPEYAVLTDGPITLPWPSVQTGPQPI